MTACLLVGGEVSGSIELAAWFDSLNEGSSWDHMLQERDECDVISFSHFLPLQVNIIKKSSICSNIN